MIDMTADPTTQVTSIRMPMTNYDIPHSKAAAWYKVGEVVPDIPNRSRYSHNLKSLSSMYIVAPLINEDSFTCSILKLRHSTMNGKQKKKKYGMAPIIVNNMQEH